MFDSTVCNVFPYDEIMLLWATAKGESGTTYYIESGNPLSLYDKIK